MLARLGETAYMELAEVLCTSALLVFSQHNFAVASIDARVQGLVPAVGYGGEKPPMSVYFCSSAKP